MDKFNDDYEKFINAAKVWGEESGPLSDKNLKIAQNIIDKLRESNDKEWVLKYKELLKHENKHVRFMVAIYLLPYCEKESIKVIKKHKKISIMAEVVLELWKKGDLKLD